jgi:hypothetical protein
METKKDLTTISEEPSSQGDETSQLLGAHNKLGKKDNAMPTVYEFDEAVWAAGGFGLFQFVSTCVLTLGLMTGSSIIFGVGYLIKYPEYDCKVGGQWMACER